MDDFLYRATPWAITLVLHNWPVMAYAALFPYLALRAYLRPTRRALLCLYGLLMLVFAYEYDKHGTRIAWDTLTYLFSREHNPVPRYASLVVALRIMPVVLHAFGIGLVLLGMFGFPRHTREQGGLQSVTPAQAGQAARNEARGLDEDEPGLPPRRAVDHVRRLLRPSRPMSNDRSAIQARPARNGSSLR
jgi:hypothetical protein